MVTSFIITIVYWSILHKGELQFGVMSFCIVVSMNHLYYLFEVLAYLTGLEFRILIFVRFHFILILFELKRVNSDSISAKSAINLTGVMSHAMNSVIMYFDILIVAYPMRLYHVIQPVCFGICFAIFSYVYYWCGGLNEWVTYEIHRVVSPELMKIYFSDTDKHLFTEF